MAAGSDVVIALDLSLRGAGMVALPLDWCGDWSRVAHHTYGESCSRDAVEALRIGRLIRIAAEVIAFVRMHSVAVVAIEQYAFNQNHSGARAIAELGGVVKHQLVEKLGMVPEIWTASAARKLVLGRNPKADVKIALRARLSQMGLPYEWNADELDAFVGANLVASERGGYALVTPPPEQKKRRGHDGDP